MNNKFEIIETSEYYLAVSDEEIKPNVYALINNILCKTEIKEGKVASRQLRGGATMDICKTEYLEIIAYQPKGNAPELDLPLLPEIVIEDDVEKLALQKYPVDEFWIGDLKTGGLWDQNVRERLKWIEGYKTATKVYSEDDMKKAYNKGFSEGVIKGTCSMAYKHESFEEYIQFLKQPKTPKWFVAETGKNMGCKDPMVCLRGCDIGTESCKQPILDFSKLKTTTNSEGKQVLVGTYLYE